MFFVCLPCRYIAREPMFLEYFLAHGLCPELCLDAWSLTNQDQAWFEGLAQSLASRNLACAVHLPYENLHPGSPDPLILDATRERLARAFAAAKLLGPRHMVGHVDYQWGLHAEDPETWLKRHTATWEALLASWPGHPPLHLENTFELDPEPVRDAVEALAATDAGKGGVGICFDAPHWHSFGRGHERKDLKRWVDCLGPRITHLHLHDNDGSGDQHLGMGQGALPWDEFFAMLEERGLAPGVTFEPHDEPSLLGSMDYLKRHPGRFARLIG